MYDWTLMYTQPIFHSERYVAPGSVVSATSIMPFVVRGTLWRGEEEPCSMYLANIIQKTIYYGKCQTYIREDRAEQTPRFNMEPILFHPHPLPPTCPQII